ncbi:MAG: hypothetical protein AAGL49_13325 [Pseudomonadota bacterium]
MSVIEREMPAVYRHKGLWTGVYRHVDVEGRTLDLHRATVDVTFPDEGPYDYIQKNHFVWQDGRETRAELPGVYRDGRLWWDTETFSGSAWQTEEGVVMLHLLRKDEPGASFTEVIIMGETGRHRARTWHWFQGGRLYKRTLCDEERV